MQVCLDKINRGHVKVCLQKMYKKICPSNFRFCYVYPCYHFPYLLEGFGSLLWMTLAQGYQNIYRRGRENESFMLKGLIISSYVK